MTDLIVRCLLPDPPLRVIAAISTEVAREAARRHGAAAGVQVALGRAATCGLLLATLTKSGEQVTMQVLGDGPLGTLIADANDSGDVRVGISHPETFVPGPPDQRVSIADAVGRRGTISVARKLGRDFRSSGQSILIAGEIDEDIEHYLTTSEQVESALGCEVLLGKSQVRAAAGVMVQCLPGADAAELVMATRARLRGGSLMSELQRVVAEADAAADAETDAATAAAQAAAIARALLGPAGRDLEVLDHRPVRFYCPCSRERVRATIALLGASDIDELIHQDGGAIVNCEFCRSQYQLDVAELEQIRAELSERAQG
ncbi:MAG: Hsp33 family molecular chaperone HslO [Haliangiales bacterium]